MATPGEAVIPQDLRASETPAWNPGTPIDQECTTSVAEARPVLKEPRRAESRKISAGKSVWNGSE